MHIILCGYIISKWCLLHFDQGKYLLQYWMNIKYKSFIVI